MKTTLYERLFAIRNKANVLAAMAFNTCNYALEDHLYDLCDRIDEKIFRIEQAEISTDRQWFHNTYCV